MGSEGAPVSQGSNNMKLEAHCHRELVIVHLASVSLIHRGGWRGSQHLLPKVMSSNQIKPALVLSNMTSCLSFSHLFSERDCCGELEGMQCGERQAVIKK